MDQSCSESDMSLSPSRILERLQMLRQLQLMQRGKLQKQRLEYHQTLESSSDISEIVSHFSNSASYITFNSLLQSPQLSSNEPSPRENNNNLSNKVSTVFEGKELIEGVSVLNLSQESEFIPTSPVSSKSRLSIQSQNENIESNSHLKPKCSPKKISLDEMPILTPKLDFEELIIKNLKNDNINQIEVPKKDDIVSGTKTKRPFLRRGEGVARFGLKSKTPVIQNIKSLPWKSRNKSNTQNQSSTQKKLQNNKKTSNRKRIEIIVEEPKTEITKLHVPSTKPLTITNKEKPKVEQEQKHEENKLEIDSSSCEIHGIKKPLPVIKMPIQKHPVKANKGKTWAAVLTKEQDNFLQQLKQTDYYKNFASPTKSTVSDMSCDETFAKLKLERELAEQNMFNLLENKVSNESFSLESSFFNNFLRNNNFECSGESTPLVMQRCLAKNPELMHLLPELMQNKQDTSHNETEGCNSECCNSECYSDCDSVSSCSTCKNEATPKSIQKSKGIKNKTSKKIVQKVQINDPKSRKIPENKLTDENYHNDTNGDDSLKANMTEINAKLVATSELLKERLQELEDEIETFRKENSNLVKLREDLDLERQKFYDEKNSFESKFNEEKILSEYYLAEEKDKLSKQKQMYEKYVREIRGRLNKKEKDEVVMLKNEISSLKDEIRAKDAKSTSTIARLRNQQKIIEKEKKDLQEEVEKLKKENRRIQHSNEITRRLTNVKYLEGINRKLNHMSKETKSEVNLDNDMKYKAFEIERQSRSRSRKVEATSKGVRPRAKSVPNLQVTSRYAKYFSQRDVISQMDREALDTECDLENFNATDIGVNDDEISNNSDSSHEHSSGNENENHLEKIYMERFQSTSPKSNRSSLQSSGIEKPNFKSNPDEFFIRKSTSDRDSKSPCSSTISPYLTNVSSLRSNLSRSPISILSNKPNSYKESTESHRSKSPISILSNRSSGSKLTTIINQENFRDKLMNLSPEPSSSKTSLTKTNLNPTEIKKPDGSRELRFPNGNVKYISADGKYTKFVYYNGDIKENFLSEGRIKYYYAEAKTIHTTHPDGLEVLEFPDGQVEKRYKDGSSEVRLPNGSTRYYDPKNAHVREEWRFPDGTTMVVSSEGEQRITFPNGQVEVHAKDHKRREFPDGTVKLVYNDGTSETRYSSGRVRIKDKHGILIMDSANR